MLRVCTYKTGYLYIRVYIWKYMCIHMCIYMYMYVYIHIYTHVCTPQRSKSLDAKRRSASPPQRSKSLDEKQRSASLRPFYTALHIECRCSKSKDVSLVQDQQYGSVTSVLPTSNACKTTSVVLHVELACPSPMRLREANIWLSHIACWPLHPSPTQPPAL